MSRFRVKWLGRTSRSEREQMLHRLYELRRETAGSHAAQCVDSYILYANIGKDRKKLGMDWAHLCEGAVEEARVFEKLLAGIGRGDA